MPDDPDPKTLLASLTRRQKLQLLAELLAENPLAANRARLKHADLDRAEAWFWQKAESAKGRIRISRRRIWLIFILLRYGGLRLKEIFRLGPEDLDLSAGLARVWGENRRETPLPPAVVARMRQIWADWAPAHISARPFVCDASLIRRSFQRCATECDLSPGLLNVHSMRRNRGRELEAAGAGSTLADSFLGRAVSGEDLDKEAAATILRQIVQAEKNVRTSARNSFAGFIREIRPRGILVEAILESNALEIMAVITQGSRMRLNLAPGVAATAIVKAPFIRLLRPGEVRSPDDNAFAGRITAARFDGMAAEIMVDLDAGPRLCAVRAGKAGNGLAIGGSVVAAFNAFAVILVAD